MATSTIKPKTGTTAQWVASGRVLEVNQWGVEVTENGHHILRIGDGEHLFHELPAVFDAENYEELMAQAVDATNAANTATANADTARDNADAAAAAALTAANTASIAAQANTNAVIETVSGEVVTMNDSSDLALTGLKLYGKTTQDGEPSPENPVPLVSVGDVGSVGVTVCGKNLYGGGNLSFVNFKAVMFDKPLPPGTYTLSAFATSTDTDEDRNLVTFFQTDSETPNVFAALKRGVRSATTVTFTKPVYGARFSASTSVDLGDGDTATVTDIMLNMGSTEMPYEPYTGQTLTAQTPNGLPGIPVTSGGNYTDANGQQWVCDEVDFARGVYVQRVGTQVLDGTEVVSSNESVIKGQFNIPVKGQKPLGGKKSMCTGFVGHPDAAYNASLDNSVSVHGSIIWIYSKKFSGSPAGLKQYFADQYAAGTPVTIKYILATPIETPLSAEEIAAFKALHSNKPNTTVYNDSGAHMAVEYIADTKTYIDNKFAELQNAILSAGANI